MSALERPNLWHLFFAYTARFMLMFGLPYRMFQSARRLEPAVALPRDEYPEDDRPAQRDREVGRPEFSV